jgi:CBS domain containing-hemolysin-like protein
VSDPALWIALFFSLMACLYGTWNTVLRTYSRSRLSEQLEDAGKPTAINWFVDQFDHLLLMTGTARIAVNLIVMLATLDFIEGHYAIQSDWLAYTTAFLVAGALISIFGLAIPLSLARYLPEAILVRTVMLLRVHMLLFSPMARMLHMFDPVVRRMSGVDIEKDDDNRVSEDVLSIVEDHESGGDVDPDQRQMIEAVFELPNTTAGEIMTPRTDIRGIREDATMEEIKAFILDAGHSRIPVYRDTIDHIVGILYVKDLVPLIGLTNASAFDLQKSLRDAMMVPESKSVRELLSEFRGKQVHIAIVLDEYGGTAGLVTIEDILEELVGEIQDEYERAPVTQDITRVDERTFEIEGRVDIDDLNDELDIELPDDEDYETIGGFVFSTLGHVPDVGEKFDYDNLTIEVLDAERTRVKRVRITLKDATDEPVTENSAAGSN